MEVIEDIDLWLKEVYLPLIVVRKVLSDQKLV